MVPRWKKHQVDGPAEIAFSYYIRSEIWYHDDKLHRIGGPAEMVEEYSDAGLVSTTERWYYHNRLIDEEWMYNGHRHRADGLAIVHITSNPEESSYEGWYILGIRVRSYNQDANGKKRCYSG